MKVTQANSTTILLSPIASATTARTSTTLDTLGCDYATIVCQIGVQANTNGATPTITLQESDTDVASNFATFNTSFNTVSVANSAAAVEVFNVDLKARKRYMRLLATPGTVASNDAILSAAVALCRKEVFTTGASTMVVG